MKTPILRITLCFVSSPLLRADRASAVAERLPGDVAELGPDRIWTRGVNTLGTAISPHKIAHEQASGRRAPTAKFGLGPGKQRASFVDHSTAGRRPRHDAKSKKEGNSFVDVGVDKEASKDVFDKLLDKVWDWCKDAEKPVSVHWDPVGEAERTAQRSKERVVNLKKTTEEAARKMLNISRDLGFLWRSLPDAIGVAKGLLKQIGDENGVLDRLVVTARKDYLLMAATAYELVPPLKRMKKALDIPLAYGRDLAKTAGELRELILGVPKPEGADRAAAENAPSKLAQADAALGRVIHLLYGLRDASDRWASPVLGKKIGGLKGDLDSLTKSLVVMQRVVKQRQADTLLDRLGQLMAMGSGARLTPEEDIMDKMLKLAQSMAITTRTVRDMYTRFSKVLDDYARPFEEIRQYVCGKFEALGVSVTNFFTTLLDQKTSDEEAREMLSNKMKVRVISI